MEKVKNQKIMPIKLFKTKNFLLGLIKKSPKRSKCLIDEVKMNGNKFNHCVSMLKLLKGRITIIYPDSDDNSL